MRQTESNEPDAPLPGEGFRPRPSPLRLWGFLVTILGGTLLGVGSLLSWATVSFGGDADVRGIDVWVGKVALGAAIVVLIGIPALRGAITHAGRKAWAITMIVVSLAALGLTAWTLIDKDDQLGLPGAEITFDENEANLPDEAFDDIVRNNPVIVQAEIGIYLTIAGSAIAAAGGVLGFVWAVKAPLPPPVGPEADDGSEPGADASRNV
ncbi:MAG: hypothetical protein WEA10_01600 [Actinomycetota bacterium]